MPRAWILSARAVLEKDEAMFEGDTSRSPAPKARPPPQRTPNKGLYYFQENTD